MITAATIIGIAAILTLYVVIAIVVFIAIPLSIVYLAFEYDTLVILLLVPYILVMVIGALL